MTAEVDRDAAESALRSQYQQAVQAHFQRDYASARAQYDEEKAQQQKGARFRALRSLVSGVVFLVLATTMFLLVLSVFMAPLVSQDQMTGKGKTKAGDRGRSARASCRGAPRR